MGRGSVGETERCKGEWCADEERLAVLSGSEVHLTGCRPKRNGEAHSIESHVGLASSRSQGSIVDRQLARSAMYFRVVALKAAEEPAECQSKAEGEPGNASI